MQGTIITTLFNIFEGEFKIIFLHKVMNARFKGINISSTS